MIFFTFYFFTRGGCVTIMISCVLVTAVLLCLRILSKQNNNHNFLGLDASKLLLGKMHDMNSG